MKLVVSVNGHVLQGELTLSEEAQASLRDGACSAGILIAKEIAQAPVLNADGDGFIVPDPVRSDRLPAALGSYYPCG
jgi:hypothetical protein